MKKQIPYRTRLAPSPTGALHLGNARTFLFIWLRCRSKNGQLIMRIEDLDHPKVKPEKIAEIYADLHWLGLDWDEGPQSLSSPSGSDGAYAPYIQSQRQELYAVAFEKLRQQGDLYPCTCTRADIQAAQSAPHEGDELFYPNFCRGKYETADAAQKDSGKIPAWRFHAPQGESVFTDNFCGTQVADLQLFSGDFVIARTEHNAAYQLAVVVDDAAMQISEVIRADDLLASTHRQLVLYEALGLTPPDFLHLPLVIGADGRRLAKRHGDTRISQIRQETSVTPQTVLGWLGYTLGLTKFSEQITLTELLARFDLKKIPHQPYVVREKDLELLQL